MIHTMKTLTFLFILSLLFGVVQVYSFRKTPKKSLATQLTDYLTYPDILRQRNWAFVILISFRVDTNQRLVDLQVYTNSLALNTAIVQQLAGKRINAAGLDNQKTHWVRVRFSPEMNK
jgi:hypothetical protein